jgi:hypothetical protein
MLLIAKACNGRSAQILSHGVAAGTLGMSEALDAVRKLTAVAEKLLLEAERLRRDVTGLSARVQPVEGIEPSLGNDPAPRPKMKWPVPDALNMIDEARQYFRNCEYELAAMRARLDNIASDAHSRDEMKPWIKE